MTTLYDTLEVPASASKATIKKAYRAKAQKLHPDKGGNLNDFQQLQLAYDVLEDDERRAQYDSEGTTNPKQSKRDEALSEFTALLILCVQKLDIEHIDIVKVMRDEIDQKQKTLFCEMENSEKAQERNKKVIERLTVKKGNNVLTQMLEANCRELDLRIDNLRKAAEVYEIMLDILKDYEYRVDKVEPTVAPQWIIDKSHFGFARPFV